MESPELYRAITSAVRKDVHRSLEEFTANNRWKQNAKVLDIGCGDGSTNKEILQKFLPTNYSQMVGSDISQNMIDYATKNFPGNKIQYVHWDISKDMPLNFKNIFDHAFSFYVLHWVKHQRAAFMNIYSTLAESGTCQLMFLGWYSMYEMFRTLSRTQKWAEDLKDVDVFISPYHDSKDPANEVSDLMESVGFKDVEVNVLKNTHAYGSDHFRSVVKAVNPFDILNNRWDEFMDDYYAVSPNGHTVDYHLIVAYGVK